jgi:5'(3')-deoxyribonucleotidase
MFAKKIFIDMDNTIVDFNKGGIANMFRKGFFQNLEAFPKAIALVQLLAEYNEIYILSKCIATTYCKVEKMKWIEANLPFIPKNNIHLIPSEVSKASYIENIYGTLNKNYILIDDYKVNLSEWEQAGGLAIKAGKQYKPERKFLQIVQCELGLWYYAL